MAGLDFAAIEKRGHYYTHELSVYVGLEPKTLGNLKSAGHPLMANAWRRGKGLCIPVEDVEAYMDRERAGRWQKP